jgi:hypothetical protein
MFAARGTICKGSITPGSGNHLGVELASTFARTSQRRHGYAGDRASTEEMIAWSQNIDPPTCL